MAYQIRRGYFSQVFYYYPAADGGRGYGHMDFHTLFSPRGRTLVRSARAAPRPLFLFATMLVSLFLKNDLKVYYTPTLLGSKNVQPDE